jgi:glycine cleavage system H lipoate-binding protein
MRCPFLREELVKYCQASAYRKMIVDAARDAGHERCSSSSWHSCPAAARHAVTPDDAGSCPWLHDARVEYCGGAAVPRYIPASDALLSHCNSDAHRFCEVFLAHADPTGERLPAPSGRGSRPSAGEGTPIVDGLPVPPRLGYAPNHTWLDVGEDGCRHVGIDAFLARVIGDVDAISFVLPRGDGRPVAVLTTHGVDLQLVSPTPLRRAVANVYLRTSPAKLTGDPYGAGWLFESVEPCDQSDSSAAAGLRHGDEAARWMLTESARLALHVHETLARRGSDGARFLADGGTPCAKLASHLERGELLDLFDQFFSLHSTGRSS